MCWLSHPCKDNFSLLSVAEHNDTVWAYYLDMSPHNHDVYVISLISLCKVWSQKPQKSSHSLTNRSFREWITAGIQYNFCAAVVCVIKISINIPHCWAYHVHDMWTCSSSNSTRSINQHDGVIDKKRTTSKTCPELSGRQDRLIHGPSAANL